MSMQNARSVFRNSRQQIMHNNEAYAESSERVIDEHRETIKRRKSQVVLKERTAKMWSKIKKIGKLSAMLSHISGESERARKQRVKKGWDVVRKVARAAMSLSAFTTQGTSGKEVFENSKECSCQLCAVCKINTKTTY